MPGDQDNSVTGRIKKFLLGSTIATNMALGAVGLFSMPLMGALIGANTAWRKSPPANGLRAMAGKAFSALMGAVGGASVGMIGSAVVAALTIVGGPVGIVAGMGLTGLAASYMGKDSAVKQGPAPAATENSEQKNVQKKGHGKERKRTQEKAPEQKKSAISPDVAQQAIDAVNRGQPGQPAQGQNGLDKPGTHSHTVG
jgi:hypothetical protein